MAPARTRPPAHHLGHPAPRSASRRFAHCRWTAPAAEIGRQKNRHFGLHHAAGLVKAKVKPECWQHAPARADAARQARTPTYVERRVDADGKVTYGDGAGCATFAKPVERVLGREATEQRDEPEGYRRQLQMESIQRARRFQQDTVEGVAQQSQGSGERGSRSKSRLAEHRPRQCLGAHLHLVRHLLNSQGLHRRESGRKPELVGAQGYHGGGGPTDRQYELEAEQARRSAAQAATQRPSMLTNWNRQGASGPSCSCCSRATRDSIEVWSVTRMLRRARSTSCSWRGPRAAPHRIGRCDAVGRRTTR